MRYSFYLGTTDTFSPFATTALADVQGIFPAVARTGLSSYQAQGVWEGVREDTLIVVADLPSDAVAQRVGYALAMATGNDAVLIDRAANEGDDTNVFNSVRPYRVEAEFAATGNRTTPVGETSGWTYVKDTRGSFVAYLVHNTGEVTAVSDPAPVADQYEDDACHCGHPECGAC